jgi:hypothetical protein
MPRVRYFLPLALVAAGAVFAFAALPLTMGGVVSFVAVALSILIARLASRSFDPRPRGAGSIAYFVLAGVVFVGSLVLVATVARGEALWLAGVLAGLVFVVFLIGIRMPIGRPSREAFSDERGA